MNESLTARAWTSLTWLAACLTHQHVDLTNAFRVGPAILLATVVFGVRTVDGADRNPQSAGSPWRFQQAPQLNPSLPRVLLIGDSIMNGYRRQVTMQLEGQANVDTWLTPLHLNSPELHEELRTVLKQGPYDVIHFNIGLHGWTPGRIPQGQYEPLLRAYVDLLQASSKQVQLIWCSTTQITVEGKPTELDPIHNQTIVTRNRTAERVMADRGVDVNDLYSLMSDKLHLASGDRFHWQTAGYEVMAAQVVSHILQALPAASPPASFPEPLTWDTPAADSRGSLPIGNGDLGANVWVEPSGELVLLLSKTDAWSENGRLLKLGRVRITMQPSFHAEGADFEQELDLRSGRVVFRSGTAPRHSSFIVWIDALAPVIHVEAECGDARQLTVQWETWRKQRRQLAEGELHSAYGLAQRPGPAVFVEADTVLNQQLDRIVFFHRNERSIWEENLRLQDLGDFVDQGEDPLLHRTFGAIIQGQDLVSEGNDRLASTSASKRHRMSVYPVTARTETAEQWVELAEQSVARASRIPLEQARAAHLHWWHDFWNRSWIHVFPTTTTNGAESDAAKVTRGYALQRWVNACAGRGGTPIKFNGSIFTVDTHHQDGKEGGFDADYRRWGGCYWWQNTRLPYWSMLAAGDFDLMPSLFKMYLDALPLREHAAKVYYDHAGAFYPETMYWWGSYCGDNYGWDRTGKPSGLTDNLYIRRYWQGGIELLAMLLDYYDYTQDAAFRDERLLPYAAATIMFFDQHWPRNDEGKIHFHPAQSLETWWDSTNPLPEIAGLRSVLPRLIDLTTDQSQKEAWTDTLQDLPPLPMMQQGDHSYLLPAEKFAEKRNQENPELYAVWPYRLYGIDRPGLDTARETWSRRVHKGTGGWSQNAIQAACLGLTDEAAQLVTENYSRQAPGFRFPAMWGPNFDWIPDQDHGCVAMIALQRMALQCDGAKIHLLPAWPDHWDIHFKLHAPQGTTVECEYRHGRIIRLVVEPAERKADVVWGELGV